MFYHCKATFDTVEEIKVLSVFIPEAKRDIESKPLNILQLITAQRPSWKGKEIQLQSKLSENQCDSYSLCHLESLLTRDITITCVMQHLLDFARKRNTPI